MLTLHPTSKKTDSGFLPMIVIRNARGQCIGSRTCKTAAPLSFKFYAETVAMIAADRVARRFPNLRVA